MIKLKHLIGHIFTKKNIKIFLLLFIVVWFFVWNSFAQSEEVPMSLVEKVSYLMHILISILSWWWVILASLAWKLMTNDFVYGTFLNLDSSLWNLWNIMKNFANFTLWFILIFTIVKNLFKTSFWDGSPIQNAKDTIVHTLVAWVLIQMSWFLIAVLIDLSTIWTAAVWSLPSQFMVGDTNFQGKMLGMIWNIENKIEIDFTNTGNITNIVRTWNLNSADDVNKLMDTIMPSSNSMVWPFIFLWASVFNLYDLTDSSKNLSWTDKWWDLFLSLWINWFVLLIFSLMLALIFVFNLFRVITLWVVIPLSPFIFLMFAFSKWWKSPIDLKNFIWEIMNIKNILKLIFMPVYMTLVLSIVLIVMVLVRSLVNADNWNLDLTEHNNMTIVSKKSEWNSDLYDSSLNVAGIASINLHLKDSIVHLLVYCLCLVLMVMLVKSCVSKKGLTWISFIDNRINWLSEILWWKEGEFWWFLWKTWVLPVWVNGKKVWIWTVMNFVGNAPGKISEKLDDVAKKQDKVVDKFFWLNKSVDDFDDLGDVTDRTEWIAKAAEIWRKKGYKTEDDFESDDKFKNARKLVNRWLASDNQVLIDHILKKMGITGEKTENNKEWETSS